MKKKELLIVVRALSEHINEVDAENNRQRRLLNQAQLSINEKIDIIELLEKKLNKL